MAEERDRQGSGSRAHIPKSRREYERIVKNLSNLTYIATYTVPGGFQIGTIPIKGEGFPPFKGTAVQDYVWVPPCAALYDLFFRKKDQTLQGLATARLVANLLIAIWPTYTRASVIDRIMTWENTLAELEGCFLPSVIRQLQLLFPGRMEVGLTRLVCDGEALTKFEENLCMYTERAFRERIARVASLATGFHVINETNKLMCRSSEMLATFVAAKKNFFFGRKIKHKFQIHTTVIEFSYDFWKLVKNGFKVLVSYSAT